MTTKQPNIVDRISALDQGDREDSLNKAYKMVKKCYNDHDYLECLAGAIKILISYQVPPRKRLKIFIYMSAAARESTEREEYRMLAENLYEALVNDLAVGEDPSAVFGRARRRLDALAARKAENDDQMNMQRSYAEASLGDNMKSVDPKSERKKSDLFKSILNIGKKS